MYSLPSGSHTLVADNWESVTRVSAPDYPPVVPKLTSLLLLYRKRPGEGGNCISSFTRTSLEKVVGMTHLWAPCRCSRSIMLAELSFGFGVHLVGAAATGDISLEITG